MHSQRRLSCFFYRVDFMNLSVPQWSALCPTTTQCTPRQLVLSARIITSTLTTHNFICHSNPRTMLLTQRHPGVWRAVWMTLWPGYMAIYFQNEHGTKLNWLSLHFNATLSLNKITLGWYRKKILIPSYFFY